MTEAITLAPCWTYVVYQARAICICVPGKTMTEHKACCRRWDILYLTFISTDGQQPAVVTPSLEMGVADGLEDRRRARRGSQRCAAALPTGQRARQRQIDVVRAELTESHRHVYAESHVGEGDRA